MTKEYTADEFAEAFSEKQLTRLSIDFLFELQHQPDFESVTPIMRGVCVFDKDEEEGIGSFVVKGHYERFSGVVVIEKIWDSDESMPDIALDLVNDLKNQTH
jgi:hypothetical protein